MKEKTKLIFAIHDLNSWGGQDRSTLEILTRLSNSYFITAVAFTFLSKKIPDSVRFVRVLPHIRRPVLLKILVYHFFTLIYLSLKKALTPNSKICATGACSLISDFIHVQFVHAHWKRIEENRSIYQRIVTAYNCITEKISFQRHKKYIAISNSVKDSLETFYALPDVTVVHHGVDTQVFQPSTKLEKLHLRESLQIPDDKFLFLYVGTYERKGLDVCLEALSKLSVQQKEKCKLVAVGNGNTQKFKLLAENLNISEQLILFPPQKNIQDFFRACDAFLFPTLYEPFGLVILEAMACGLPPIVSKLAGASELAEQGKSAFLIDNPKDSQEISTYMAKIIEDSDLYLNMSVNSRRVAESRTWDRVACEYASVVENRPL